MAPALALRYSSHSPLRGGLAVGWTLELPTIEQDLSLGADAGKHYKAALGSATERLVKVDDKLPYGNAVAAYRVNFDTTFTRFFHRKPNATQSFWTALTTDGVKHQFTTEGEPNNDPRWRIKKQIDPFGNTVEYFWSIVPGPDGAKIDYRLDRIEYSANERAGLAAHAKVEFDYAPLEFCQNGQIPLGAAKRRGSIEVDGASRLTHIRTYVRDTQTSATWRMSRQVNLSYALDNSILFKDPLVEPPPQPTQNRTFACKQNRLRYLTHIEETAYAPDGSRKRFPPMTFKYNRRINTTGRLEPHQPDPLARQTVSWDQYGASGTSGRFVGGATSNLYDIDGDGVADHVSVQRNNQRCMLIWRQGRLGGGYGPARQFALPTAPWYTEWSGIANEVASAFEGCTLSGQIAYRHYFAPQDNEQGDGLRLAKGMVSYHFLDYNGDGRLDLLTNVWATDCHWTYDPDSDRNWGDPKELCPFKSETNGAVAAARVVNEVPLPPPILKSE